MEIVKCLEESCLFINSVNKTIENEAKEQEGGFSGMLLDILGDSLLINMFAAKVRINRQAVIRSGKGKIRAGQGF